MDTPQTSPQDSDLLRLPDFQAALGLAKATALACHQAELTPGALLAGIALAAQRGLLLAPLPEHLPAPAELLHAARASGLSAAFAPLLAPEPAPSMPLAPDLRALLASTRQGPLPALVAALYAAATDPQMQHLRGLAGRIAEGASIPPGALALAALELQRRTPNAFDASVRAHLSAHADDLDALARRHGWRLPEDPAQLHSSEALLPATEALLPATEALLPAIQAQQPSATTPQPAELFHALIAPGIREAVAWRLRQRVATHEAGHAAVSLLLRPQVRIDQVTVREHGNSLGRVTYRSDCPAWDLPQTRADLMARLCVALAGRAAQRHRYGPEQVDTGSETDLEQATEHAWRGISLCGFDDTLGPVSLRALAKHGGASSPWLQQQAQQRLQALMLDADLRCARLIDAHWPRIEALADTLAERETLNEREVLHLILPQTTPDQQEKTS